MPGTFSAGRKSFFFWLCRAEIVSAGRPRPAPPTVATTLYYSTIQAWVSFKLSCRKFRKILILKSRLKNIDLQYELSYFTLQLFVVTVPSPTIKLKIKPDNKTFENKCTNVIKLAYLFYFLAGTTEWWICTHVKNKESGELDYQNVRPMPMDSCLYASRGFFSVIRTCSVSLGYATDEYYDIPPCAHLLSQNRTVKSNAKMAPKIILIK